MLRARIVPDVVTPAAPTMTILPAVPEGWVRGLTIDETFNEAPPRLLFTDTEPTDEADATPTTEPTTAPTVIVTSTGADFTLSPSDTTSTVASLEPIERFVNGGFESDFDDL